MQENRRSLILGIGAAALSSMLGAGTVVGVFFHQSQKKTVPRKNPKPDLGVTPDLLQPDLTPSLLEADNLYFHLSTAYLNLKETEQIGIRVQEKFAEAGIGFKNFSVLQERSFPKLSGLDILIYLIDDKIVKRHEACPYLLYRTPNCPTRPAFGQFSLYPDKPRRDYQKLKRKLKFTYDVPTSIIHTGFVVPSVAPTYIEKEIGNKKYAREDELRLTTRVIAHEVAHGLTAQHAMGSIKEKEIYIMTGYPLPFQEVSFCRQNAKEMKQYINFIRTHPNLSRKEVIKLQEEWSGWRIMNPFPLDMPYR